MIRPAIARVIAPAIASVIAPAIALVISSLLAGCGGSAPPVEAPRPTITIEVTPSATSNRGRPLRAVVRAVTLKQFVEDHDARIAQLVVNPDDTVLSSFVVFPGVPQTIKLDPPKGGVAVYFLFTGATGTSWKQLFDGPPARIKIDVGDNAIIKATPAAATPR